MRWWKWAVRLLTVAVVLGTLMMVALPGMPLAAGAAPKQVTIRLCGMQQAGMTPEELNAVAKEFQAKYPNITVKTTFVGYDALHDKLVTALSGRNQSYDLVLVDDIWYAQFARAEWLLDITNRITKEMRDDIYRTAWDVVTVNGTVYGMPWFLDEKYFFYNKEILAKAGISAPPRTWEELAEQARIIKEKKLVEYPIIWSWAQQECSICDWVTILGSNGGEFFDAKGDPAFNSKEGVEALEWMVKTLKDGLSNPASTAVLEEDVRSTYSQGKAAFCLNWIYMYNMANDPNESKVVGQTEMALIPVFKSALAKGIKSSSINGSMGFSIASRTEHPDEAWLFLDFLCGKYIQKKYPKNITPIWVPLAKDPELLQTIGVGLKMFSEQFPYAHVRPKVPNYNEISKIIQLALQEALTFRKPPKQALDDAVATIKALD